MDTLAVLLKSPGDLALARVGLVAPAAADVVIDVLWSGISTGTERLLYTGDMPPFPGMGYPLVPGYETVGVVAETASKHDDGQKREPLHQGALVFVPGARCYTNAHGLFGGAARRLVVPQARVIAIPEQLGERGVLVALAATAQHALAGGLPDLIVGHGVLGRLIARLCIAHGGAAPAVWERDPSRTGGAAGYSVTDADSDPRRDYQRICDVSGDSAILDSLVGRMAAGGEIVLAGFYAERLSFAFPPAFMREARIRIAAQWQPADLATVLDLVASRHLSLDGLITHRASASDAPQAYEQAFGDPACLKMILDWRTTAQ
ncbi:MAG: chlorophyll synthesis pathway protein BchC [Hyphomicrobiaceae bacterium]|nr:chlorophyll synthesis pathway protein BchC [Hyphomicrobiaceae bacterium]